MNKILFPMVLAFSLALGSFASAHAGEDQKADAALAKAVENGGKSDGDAKIDSNAKIGPDEVVELTVSPEGKPPTSFRLGMLYTDIELMEFRIFGVEEYDDDGVYDGGETLSGEGEYTDINP